jgi:hypothetical protein
VAAVQYFFFIDERNFCQLFFELLIMDKNKIPWLAVDGRRAKVQNFF